MTSLVAVGCGGTNLNTGMKIGDLKRIEVALGRSVPWFFCTLYSNHLPLRHIFICRDSKTPGPISYNGPIGNELQISEK